MTLDEAKLELALSERLATPVKVAAARDPLPAAALTARESDRLLQFELASRRAEWLTGRAALKRLLAALGEDEDTSKIDFPCARISLTHSDDCALAMVSLAPSRGIGVDLERYRAVHPGVARFFLNDKERCWWSELDESERSRELLRLWTVKEALFKSHPHNRDTMLADYAVENPAQHTGRARLGGASAGTLRYTSLIFPDAMLSAAVCF
jgi:4'-phosphopantetheinyl transferase EntD